MRAFFLVLILLTCSAPAFGFGKGAEGCSGDCTACHKVTLDEVKDIFKNLDPGVAVEDVTPAPARSLYQVTLRKEGQAHVAYLDFSKNYLLAGQLIDIRNKRDLTRQSVEDAATINPADIPLENAIVAGNPKGSKVLYLFSDPECPYCATLHQTVRELIREEPELKVYILLVPLDIHPDALWKTESMVCASKTDQKSALAMLEGSYEQKEVARLNCAAGVGAEQKKVGTRLGIAVTPTLCFASGKLLRGARSKEEIRKLLVTQKPESLAAQGR
jgi:thiol:disulfide interchange protein DsbC